MKTNKQIQANGSFYIARGAPTMVYHYGRGPFGYYQMREIASDALLTRCSSLLGYWESPHRVRACTFGLFRAGAKWPLMFNPACEVFLDLVGGTEMSPPVKPSLDDRLDLVSRAYQPGTWIRSASPRWRAFYRALNAPILEREVCLITSGFKARLDDDLEGPSVMRTLLENPESAQNSR